MATDALTGQVYGVNIILVNPAPGSVDVDYLGTRDSEPPGRPVYRKQIRPVVTGGAAIMDQLFPRRDGGA